MKKLSVLFVFFIIVFVLRAENFGSEIMPEEAFFYFNSENIDILEVDNRKIDVFKEELSKYADFYGINFTNFLKNGEYSIAFYKNEENKLEFFMAKKMKLADFILSPLYNNGSFESDFIKEINVKYILGDTQFIYGFKNDTLYLGNNINLFFKTMENSIMKENVLEDKENFKKLLSKNIESEYKYYLEYETPLKIMGYEVNSEVLYSNTGNNKKYYLITKFEDNEEDVINFADFIVDNPDKIYLGRKTVGLYQFFNKDFEVLKDGSLGKIDDGLYDNIDFIVEITKNNKNYFVLYAKNDWNKFINNIVKKYEEIYFYDYKLEIKQDENVEYFEIPLLGIKNYFVIKNGDYIVLSKDEEITKEIGMGKFYNQEYIEVLKNQDITIDVKNNKKTGIVYEDGLLYETYE